MSLRRVFKGQALTEYAMPIALIALVSIPALVIMGGNLGDYTKDTSDTIKGNPQAALQAAASNTDRWMNVTTGKNLGPYQGQYDMGNGNISVKIPSFLGGGQANFSEGAGMTRQLSQMLAQMAEKFRDENGGNMPNSLKKSIDQLANIGSALADQEAWVNGQIAQGKSGSINMWNLIGLYEAYASQYNTVLKEISKAGGGKAINEVEGVVKGYSGIISSNAYANYLNPIDNGAYNSGYNANAAKSLVGTSPQRLASQGRTPVVTRHSAGQIDKAI